MTAPTELPARERILATAGQLFYRHGYHAVGVDTIIAESGVAKMTLYRHFASKDVLIAAYLERSHRQLMAMLEEAAATQTTALEQLQAVCRRVTQIAVGPECLGCVFQMSAGEFPDREHPANRAAVAHKTAVRAFLRRLAEEARLRDSVDLADQLMLLIDGAWALARVLGPENPAHTLPAAAEVLIAAHLPQVSSSK